MKNINLNRKKYIGLCVLCSLVMLFTGCKDDTKIPSEFFPEQFFVVETGHELNIDTKSSFELNSTCKCNRILINNLFKFFVWREVHLQDRLLQHLQRK